MKQERTEQASPGQDDFVHGCVDSSRRVQKVRLGAGITRFDRSQGTVGGWTSLTLHRGVRSDSAAGKIDKHAARRLVVALAARDMNFDVELHEPPHHLVEVLERYRATSLALVGILE